MTEATDKPVEARVFILDPSTLTVTWMNEAARDAMPGAGPSQVGSPVASVVPLADVLGLVEAVESVARDGIARHLSADLVSTAKGSVALVASVYRLPAGSVLLVTENAWQPGVRSPRAMSRG